MGNEGFLLLEPGPRHVDEPHGGGDLITYYGLRRLHDSLTTVGLQPTNYLRGVLGDSELRRGTDTDLAPLAGVFSSTHTPEFKPLTPEQLRKAFSLKPGKFSLTEAEKGVVVSPALRGSTPSTGTNTGVSRDEDSLKDRDKKAKKDRKEKKERKDKKRQREKSEQREKSVQGEKRKRDAEEI